LAKTYGNERLEAACSRALVLGAFSYSTVKNMLKSGTESKPLKSEERPQLGEHENVRAKSYYE